MRGVGTVGQLRGVGTIGWLVQYFEGGNSIV